MTGAPSRPSVMRVVTRLNVGGPARHVVLLNRELETRGFRCSLVSGSAGKQEGALPPGDGPHVHLASLKRPIDPVADIRAARALQRLIRSRRPEIVHTHMAKAGTLGRLAAHRARVRVVVHTFHGHVLEGYFAPWQSRAFLEVERRLARWTDALVAVSSAVRDELLDLGIGRVSQWHVVPLGLDLDDLVAGPMPGPAARRRLGLPEEVPVVGIVGRLAPVKDHGTFLEAAAHIGAVRPDVTFVVAGDGALRPDLERRARRFLGQRVRFMGWVHDLPALYGALDVVVLTSRNEGTPVALIEAAAARTPVVATRVGGVGEVVREGETGWLVRPGDGAGIAARVLDLLDRPDVAREMGTAGRRHVVVRFSASRLGEDIAALYGDLLERRPARQGESHEADQLAGSG